MSHCPCSECEKGLVEDRKRETLSASKTSTSEEKPAEDRPAEVSEDLSKLYVLLAQLEPIHKILDEQKMSAKLLDLDAIKTRHRTSLAHIKVDVDALANEVYCLRVELASKDAAHRDEVARLTTQVAALRESSAFNCRRADDAEGRARTTEAQAPALRGVVEAARAVVANNTPVLGCIGRDLDAMAAALTALRSAVTEVKTRAEPAFGRPDGPTPGRLAAYVEADLTFAARHNAGPTSDLDAVERRATHALRFYARVPDLAASVDDVLPLVAAMRRLETDLASARAEAAAMRSVVDAAREFVPLTKARALLSSQRSIEAWVKLDAGIAALDAKGGK